MLILNSLLMKGSPSGLSFSSLILVNCRQQSDVRSPSEDSSGRQQKDTNKEVFKQQLTKDLHIPQEAEFVKKMNLTRVENLSR